MLDVSQVPELFVLLHSSELPLQRTQQRSFLLQLLRDGMRDRLDYLVCARRRVFRLLLSLQPSELLADSSTKVKKFLKKILLKTIQYKFLGVGRIWPACGPRAMVALPLFSIILNIFGVGRIWPAGQSCPCLIFKHPVQIFMSGPHVARGP